MLASSFFQHFKNYFKTTIIMVIVIIIYCVCILVYVRTLYVCMCVYVWLQTLVTQKERQSERYCQLLQEARSELRTMTRNHDSETTALVRKMQEQSDSAVRRLREVSMETVAVTTVAGATEKELARLRQLEDLIGQQRATHDARLSEVRRERERDRREYETSLVRVRQEMGELKSKHFIENEGISINNYR